MRSCDLRREILRLFAKNEHHGYELQQLLKSQGISVGSTRLYRLLDEMRKDGVLEGRWMSSDSGPRKRIYSLTSNGVAERMEILQQAIRTVHDFYLEYIRSLPAERSILQAFKDSIVSELPQDGIILGIMTMYNSAFDSILRYVSDELPDCSAYAIRVEGFDMDIATEWTDLKGAFDDIPLKDNSVSFLLIAGFHKEFAKRSMIHEWKRVLKPDGNLLLITPSSLCKPLIHPLTIGDFIEFYEHNNFAKPLVAEWESFMKHLEATDFGVQLESMNDLFILKGSISKLPRGVQGAKVQIVP